MAKQYYIHNIDFATLGIRTLNYYNTSNTTIESATYSALKSDTITTHGGGLLIFGYVYGTVTSGIAYLYAKVDNTEYKLGQINNAATNLQGIYYVPPLTAGSHTVSFGVTRQDGTGRTFTIPGYSINQVQFIEC